MFLDEKRLARPGAAAVVVVVVDIDVVDPLPPPPVLDGGGSDVDEVGGLVEAGKHKWREGGGGGEHIEESMRSQT